MAKFDDIKIDLSKKVTEINIKASSFLEINKMKTYINTLNEEIEDIQKNIGETVYQMWLDEEVKEVELVPYMEIIKEKQTIIKEQYDAIEELEQQGKNVLGKEKKMEHDAYESYCSACGVGYKQKVNFCKQCGAKLD